MQGLKERISRVLPQKDVGQTDGSKPDPNPVGETKKHLLHKWLVLSALPAAFVYLEILLRIAGGDTMRKITWIYPIGFACAAGFLLTLLCLSIPRKKIGRIIGLVILGVTTLLFLVAFFVNNAFQVYMDPASILSGVSDLATGFTETAISAVQSGAGYLVLFLLPFLLFCLFWGRKQHPLPKLQRRTIPILLGIAAVCYLIPLTTLELHTPDRAMYTDQFQFDRGIRNFGLLTGVCLEVKNQMFSGTGEELVTLSANQDNAVPENYGYNALSIPFDTLIDQEASQQIKQIHSYVSNLAPSTKNKYTGLFAGKNLILITAEAFSAEVIDPELTPTLYRLANQGIVFQDYYQPAWGGSTSTGEYSILSGLIPTSGVSSIKKTVGQNLYCTMGNQLQRLGYHSAAYHNGSYTYYDRHKTHENFGYATFTGMGNGMEQGVTEQWPESDLEMMQFTAEQYIEKQPFSIYYMTVSGHCLYHPGSNDMTDKNWDAIKKRKGSDAIRGYLAAQLELEYSLEYLVSALEAAGIANDTVIVLSTDHYPYGLEKSSTWNNSKDYLSELYGKPATDAVTRDHSALIVWSGCLETMDPIVVDTPVYSLDILPTLSNLFGLAYDSRLLVGRDVFSKQEPLVLWMDYSWLTDKGYYNAGSGTFTPKDGVTVEDGYAERISAEVKNKMAYSKNVLAYDYFSILFEEPSE